MDKQLSDDQQAETTSEVRSESFEFKYDGPALEKGEFDAILLGRSLIALNALLTRTNTMENGDGSKLVLRVQSFRKGSFEISFGVAMSWVQQLLSFLGSSEASGLTNLLTLIGFVKGDEVSLMDLVRATAGQKPVDVTKHDNGEVTVVGSNNTVTVSKTVYKFYNSSEIAKSLEDITAPLKHPGIESLTTSHEGHRAERFTKQDAQYLSDRRTILDAPLESQREMTVTIKKCVMPATSPWRFYTPFGEISAKITDPTFLMQLNFHRKAIALGDTLAITLLTRETTAYEKTSYEFEVIKVTDHTPVSAIVPPADI